MVQPVSRLGAKAPVHSSLLLEQSVASILANTQLRIPQAGAARSRGARCDAIEAARATSIIPHAVMLLAEHGRPRDVGRPRLLRSDMLCHAASASWHAPRFQEELPRLAAASLEIPGKMPPVAASFRTITEKIPPLQLAAFSLKIPN
jgi:hypothetical protein